MTNDELIQEQYERIYNLCKNDMDNPDKIIVLWANDILNIKFRISGSTDIFYYNRMMKDLLNEKLNHCKKMEILNNSEFIISDWLDDVITILGIEE